MIADATWVPVILVRWVHVLCAALLIGGTFFIGFLLPMRTADDSDPAAPADPGYLRSRRPFKIVTHACILFLILSGIYNAYGNWQVYKLNPAFSHSLFGSHVLLAVIVIVLLLVTFAHRQPRPGEKGVLRGIALLLFLTVLAASSLKYVRDHTHALSHASTQPSGAARD